MRLATLAVLSCCLAAAAPLAHAADASVEKRLDERGLKYQVDDDGDYRIIYDYKEDGRTQLVYVSGSTETTRSFVVREVFAPAADVADGITGAKALELLADSRGNKLGSWEMNGNTLVYVIKLPDDVSAAALEAAMDTAATAADNMEIKLSGGKDKY